MLNITFILPDKNKVTVAANEGDSLMQTAVDNDIEQISGDCGGCCSCATCHCFIDDKWKDKMLLADDMETELLEGAIDNMQENSRLACQIFLSKEHDGLVVHVPESDW
jgi:2Fe-2S ferredoxin